jgi:hypothetical protein
MRRKMNVCAQTALRFSAALLLFCCFVLSVSGQTETNAADVPEYASAQVVRRILTWYFKPRTKPKTIYLAAKGIKKEWLPEIKNIEFQMLTDEEVKQNGQVYFFREPEFSNGKYKIDFGYGDPNCNNQGDTWFFRLSNERVRLWKGNYLIGWGSGCGVGSGESSGSGSGSSNDAPVKKE